MKRQHDNTTEVTEASELPFELLVVMTDLASPFLQPRDTSRLHRVCQWTAVRWRSLDYVTDVVRRQLDETERCLENFRHAEAWYWFVVFDEILLALKLARVLIHRGLSQLPSVAKTLRCDSKKDTGIFFGRDLPKSTAKRVIKRVSDDRLKDLTMNDGDELPAKLRNAFRIALNYVECRYGWHCEEPVVMFDTLICFSYTPVFVFRVLHGT